MSCVEAFARSRLLEWTGQRVVTCMSYVEPFVTKIKIESSDHNPFMGFDQGIKKGFKLLESTDQEHVAAI